MIDRVALRSSVAAMMEAAWREPGFCVPNQATYPHQWLWDSCFHALVWSALGSDRGVTEIRCCFEQQGPDGFVPHMIYWSEPEAGRDFWGRSLSSSITQPPMFGHALARLIRDGHPVPDQLLVQARRALLHLAERTRTPAGLVPVYHPWETGCDDSARWDSWLPEGPGTRVERWRRFKGQVVAELTLGPDGQALASERFTVGSVGFNALVAWNAAELSTVMAGPLDPDGTLSQLAAELSLTVSERWSGDRWLDDGPPSGAIRTADSMLALLVDPRPEGFDQLVDPAGFGAPFGPRGVHRQELSYEPTTYWRGPAWPQLSYLLFMAAQQAGRADAAEATGTGLVAGAARSGLAEFWDPETGRGLGAIPQSWAGLGLVVAEQRR